MATATVLGFGGRAPAKVIECSSAGTGSPLSHDDVCMMVLLVQNNHATGARSLVQNYDGQVDRLDNSSTITGHSVGSL